jgi:predicted NAD-dependent protein-ADP-ribosyltransferase YbiA (DUF1768 family)
VKVLLFREKINHIITHCFGNQKQLHNLLQNTLEAVLLEHENSYNNALADKIFEEEVKDSEETVQSLFKLIPNKERFIRTFEGRFFQWVIYRDVHDLLYQEAIVQMMKKECGSVLCRKIDRMLLDVWRDGRMIVYHNSVHNFHVSLDLDSVDC